MADGKEGPRLTAETDTADESYVHDIPMAETHRAEVYGVLWWHGKWLLPKARWCQVYGLLRQVRSF